MRLRTNSDQQEGDIRSLVQEEKYAIRTPDEGQEGNTEQHQEKCTIHNDKQS